MTQRLVVVAWFALSLLLILPAPLAAQEGGLAPEVVVLSNETDTVRLGRYLATLRDPKTTLTLDDVMAPPYRDRFVPSTQDVPSFGRSTAAYWARVSVRNDSSAPLWILAFDVYLQSYVDYYLVGADGRLITRTQTGTHLPFSTRDIRTAVFAFQVPIPPEGDATLYLRIAGDDGILRFPVRLESVATFGESNDLQLLLLSSLYGFLLLTAAYNLLIGLSLRDEAHLLLSLFIIALALSFAVRDGRTAQFLWPENPVISRLFTPIAVGLVVTSLLLFAASFLQTRELMPRLHKALLGLTVPSAAGALLAPFAMFGWFTYSQLTGILVFLAIAAVVLILIAGPLALRRGNLAARYFVAAEFIPFLIGIVDALSVIGILPVSEPVAVIPIGGNVLLILLLSLALADRVQFLNREVERATVATRATERLARQYLDAIPLGAAIYDKDLNLVYANRSLPALVGQPEGAKYNLPASPARYPAYCTDTDEPYPQDRNPIYLGLAGVATVVDDLSLDVEGVRVPLEVWCTPLRNAEYEVESVAVIAADITEKKRAEAELVSYRDHLEVLVAQRTRALQEANQALEEKQRVAEALREVATLLSAGKSQPEVLNEILRLLARVLPYDGAAIYLDDGADILCVGAAGAAEADRGERIPISSGNPKARVYSEGRALILSDPRSRDATPLQDDVAGHWIGLPLMAEGKAFGILSIDHCEECQYRGAELGLLAAFASQAAAAALNNRLYVQAQMNAASQERDRLARDLHDAVTQTLFSTSLIADMLPEQMQVNPDEAMTNLAKVAELTRGALAEMRTLLMELRPSALVATHLDQLVDNLTQAAVTRSRIAFSYHVHGADGLRLPPDVQIAVYRIVQESLNNVMKHSGASKCLVDLWYHADGVEIAISDNGRGFDPEAVSSGHLGLSFMRERSLAVGADLTIESQPDEGAHVRVSWRAASAYVPMKG